MADGVDEGCVLLRDDEPLVTADWRGTGVPGTRSWLGELGVDASNVGAALEVVEDVVASNVSEVDEGVVVAGDVRSRFAPPATASSVTALGCCVVVTERAQPLHYTIVGREAPTLIPLLLTHLLTYIKRT